MELGGINLGTDLYREAILGYSRIDSKMVLSRTNTPLIWEQEAGPQAFDLVGGENSGTLTGTQINAILNLASIIGATYDFDYNSTIITVRFRTWDQPVIEYSPLGPREAMGATDIYRNIKIKLMEV